MSEATTSMLPELPLQHEFKTQSTPESNKDIDESSSKSPKMAEKARLRVHVDDVVHPTALYLVRLLNISTLSRHAIDRVHEHLYTPYGKPQSVRSVTLIFRSMGGVAYTDGLPLDEEHKEIHFSLDYLTDVMKRSTDLEFILECLGIVTHEMVHCFQQSAHGTAPGWLIEGIADFVRLKSGLAPPHWKKGPTEESRGKNWEAGYQKTAWFLEFLETKFGPGTVSKMNSFMRTSKYEEKEFWPKLFHGKSLKELWDRYRATWKDDEDSQMSEVMHARAAVLIAEEICQHADGIAASARATASAARDSAEQLSTLAKKALPIQRDVDR